MLIPVHHTKFEKEVEKAQQRGWDISKLKEVMRISSKKNLSTQNIATIVSIAASAVSICLLSLYQFFYVREVIVGGSRNICT
jgi:hypothetical protein